MGKSKKGGPKKGGGGGTAGGAPGATKAQQKERLAVPTNQNNNTNGDVIVAIDNNNKKPKTGGPSACENNTDSSSFTESDSGSNGDAAPGHDNYGGGAGQLGMTTTNDDGSGGGGFAGGQSQDDPLGDAQVNEFDDLPVNDDGRGAGAGDDAPPIDVKVEGVADNNEVLEQATNPYVSPERWQGQKEKLGAFLPELVLKPNKTTPHTLVQQAQALKTMDGLNTETNDFFVNCLDDMLSRLPRSNREALLKPLPSAWTTAVAIHYADNPTLKNMALRLVVTRQNLWWFAIMLHDVSAKYSLNPAMTETFPRAAERAAANPSSASTCWASNLSVQNDLESIDKINSFKDGFALDKPQEVVDALTAALLALPRTGTAVANSPWNAYAKLPKGGPEDHWWKAMMILDDPTLPISRVQHTEAKPDTLRRLNDVYYTVHCKPLPDASSKMDCPWSAFFGSLREAIYQASFQEDEMYKVVAAYGILSILKSLDYHVFMKPPATQGELRAIYQICAKKTALQVWATSIVRSGNFQWDDETNVGIATAFWMTINGAPVDRLSVTDPSEFAPAPTTKTQTKTPAGRGVGVGLGSNTNGLEPTIVVPAATAGDGGSDDEAADEAAAAAAATEAAAAADAGDATPTQVEPPKVILVKGARGCTTTGQALEKMTNSYSRQYIGSADRVVSISTATMSWVAARQRKKPPGADHFPYIPVTKKLFCDVTLQLDLAAVRSRENLMTNLNTNFHLTLMMNAKYIKDLKATGKTSRVQQLVADTTNVLKRHYPLFDQLGISLLTFTTEQKITLENPNKSWAKIPDSNAMRGANSWDEVTVPIKFTLMIPANNLDLFNYSNLLRQLNSPKFLTAEKNFVVAGATLHLASLSDCVGANRHTMSVCTNNMPKTHALAVRFGAQMIYLNSVSTKKKANWVNLLLVFNGIITSNHLQQMKKECPTCVNRTTTTANGGQGIKNHVFTPLQVHFLPPTPKVATRFTGVSVPGSGGGGGGDDLPTLTAEEKAKELQFKFGPTALIQHHKEALLASRPPALPANEMAVVLVPKTAVEYYRHLVFDNAAVLNFEQKHLEVDNATYAFAAWVRVRNAEWLSEMAADCFGFNTYLDTHCENQYSFSAGAVLAASG
jgi:hypothetical protein